MSEIEKIFALNGSLSEVVPEFRARPGQVEMAKQIDKAIRSQKPIVAEAGTGTGKTFAYLVPALLSGGKVIVSTGTKNLQDQLFDRDIPTVRKALKAPVSVALLKGRANYVCHHHLANTQADGRLSSRDDVRYLQLIARFSQRTQSGDRADCADVPENASVWSLVTSNRENCLGSQCEDYEQCFVMKARKQALAADVVVVNHHLFFADVALRDEGISELLPSCNTVIFDEAHQLPDTASLFFGETVSTALLIDLARDARMEAIASARDFAPLPEAAIALDKAARDLRLSRREEVGRIRYQQLIEDETFMSALKDTSVKLSELFVLLESQAERSEGLEHCRGRAQELAQKISRWTEAKDLSFVRWSELFGSSLQLHATPLSIADIFRKQITETSRSWVFTSATLSVNGNFKHYCDELGLEGVQTESWPSPFDYERNSLLYVPENLPNPNDREHTATVVNEALPIIKASGGRAFLLFTSLRAMREAAQLLREAFEVQGLIYPVLLQGEGSRTELLDRFRELGNAVLVASQSFWEGVDVRGEALSVVVIDRLPFSPPDDPVLAARIEKMNEQGRNAFMDYQVPQAVISLKQGAGRLIRDENDRGVLMICDPRLVEKRYGKRIWRSLPPMKRTRLQSEAIQFFSVNSDQKLPP
jgi:ATP-dependent DNA helicase DinG